VSPTSRRRRRRILPILIVVVAALAAAAWFLAPRLTGATASDGSPTGTGAGNVAAGPTGTTGGADATASTSAPYTIKPEPTKVATDTPVPSSHGNQVQVVLTYAGFDAPSGTVQANGLVAGVIEDGGTCTLTLTRGSDVVTARSTAGADATTTTCGLLETGTGLAAGTWQAVLSYTSDSATGTSQTMAVVVR
jgi:hypothetical protein